MRTAVATDDHDETARYRRAYLAVMRKAATALTRAGSLRHRRNP